MKHILIAILFLPILLHAQETVKVKTEREKYYVLKSDKATKQGPYELSNYDGKPTVEGHYNLGLKDSIWISYNWFTGTIESKDEYINDQQAGVWEYYDSKGALEQKYDYSKKELLFNKKSEEDNNSYRAIHNQDTVTITSEKLPIYIGGNLKMHRDASEHIKYPGIAREYGIAGTVFICFVLEKNGMAKDHRIIKGIGYGCDEEALKGVKNIPNNWIPGTNDGEPIDMEITMPVGFTLK